MSHQNHLVQHHIHNKKRLNLLDKVAVVIAFLYPLTGIPQIIEAMSGSVDGISLLSWAGFITFSLFFFIYGVIHKIKPVIITNFLWIIVDITVVVAVIVRQMMS